MNQWYAVPHVVSPSTSAMVLANKYLPLLKSFLQYPQSHAQAVKTPSLAGGSFVDVDPSRVEEVRALVAATEKECAELIGFAQDIKALDALLLKEATGDSLEPFYARVPERLKGYVELRYDLHHRASVRFIEALLYRGPYYRQASQSLQLSFAPEVRPFNATTPRLEGPGVLTLRLPFVHEGVRALLQMKDVPGTLPELAEKLGLGPGGAEALAPYFTDAVPRRTPRFDGDGVRVRYFGHACLLIETRGLSILTDPGIGYEVPGGVPRYSYADLPERIDFVLVSHAHADHLWLETLFQLRHKIGAIVVPKNNGGTLSDPSLRLMLSELGFPNVRELDELERLEVEGGSITGLPALGEHGDLDVRSKGGFLVRLAGRTLMLMGDANVLEQRLYAHLRDFIGDDLDALFLGMEATGAPVTWGYGALFSSPPPHKMAMSRRLNSVDSERAIPLLERLEPRRVCIYAMGREPWTSHLMGSHVSDDAPHVTGSTRVVQYCRDKGIPVERPFSQLELVL